MAGRGRDPSLGASTSSTHPRARPVVKAGRLEGRRQLKCALLESPISHLTCRDSGSLFLGSIRPFWQLADRPRLQAAPCAPPFQALVDRRGRGPWALWSCRGVGSRPACWPKSCAAEAAAGYAQRDARPAAGGVKMAARARDIQTGVRSGGSRLCFGPGSRNQQHGVSTSIPVIRKRSGFPARASRIQDDGPDH
jgi:hypothetical protein